MIVAMHEVSPDLSMRRLCELVGAGRTWSDTHPSADEVAARDTALRDAIARIVVDFPGDG